MRGFPSKGNRMKKNKKRELIITSFGNPQYTMTVAKRQLGDVNLPGENNSCFHLVTIYQF